MITEVIRYAKLLLSDFISALNAETMSTESKRPAILQTIPIARNSRKHPFVTLVISSH